MTYNEGLERGSAMILSYPPVSQGTEHDDKVLSYCYNQARNVADIAAHLGISNSSYLRSKVLNNLAQQGYLLVSRQSRTKFYKTNSDMVALG